MGKGVPTDDPERIWLRPEYGGGRSWFEYRTFENDTEYVRADLVEQRTCENCQHDDRTADGARFCNALGMHTREDFGCTLFEAKQ